MIKSPFKFLDSYTKEDKDLFFGRNKETEELYQKVFESRIVLLYGVSGTGKSSLINCGLANKFEDSDWLPILIRRGDNIVNSIEKQIQVFSLSELKLKQVNDSNDKILNLLQSVYLDHFKPVYLIFDQLEELFIFGNKEERKEFISIIKSIRDSGLQCKVIFSMREEYLAGLTEFEESIPEIMDNRYRVEKMIRKAAIDVIEGTCNEHSIEIQSGFSEALLEKLSSGSNEIELTYLQVYLDMVYRIGQDELSSGSIQFDLSLVERVGDVSDLLGNFLEDQIKQIDDPEMALIILKSFVSIKGTKKQLTVRETVESAKSLGKSITESQAKEIIQSFINLRILREKDENDKYELRHDSLASKIFDKITSVEKDIIEITYFLNNAFSDFETRNRYLSKDDLEYIAPYENKIFLPKNLSGFINASKKVIEKSLRRKRLLAVGITGSVIIALTFLFFWAMNERQNAIENERAAIEASDQAKISEEQAIDAMKRAENSELLAINAKEIAEEELYESIKNTWTISAENMNVLYLGIENPVQIIVSGISSSNIFATISQGTIRRVENGFTVKPSKIGDCIINVTAKNKNNELIDLGERFFRIKKIPSPYAIIDATPRSDGTFEKAELLLANRIDCGLNADLEYDSMNLFITSFALTITKNGWDRTAVSNSNRFTSEQKSLIRATEDGDKIYITQIAATSAWQKYIQISSLIIDVNDEEKKKYYDALIGDIQELLFKYGDNLLDSALVSFRSKVISENNLYLADGIVNSLNQLVNEVTLDKKISIYKELLYYIDFVNSFTDKYRPENIAYQLKDLNTYKSINSTINKLPDQALEFALNAMNKPNRWNLFEVPTDALLTACLYDNIAKSHQDSFRRLVSIDDVGDYTTYLIDSLRNSSGSGYKHVILNIHDAISFADSLSPVRYSFDQTLEKIRLYLALYKATKIEEYQKLFEDLYLEISTDEDIILKFRIAYNLQDYWRRFGSQLVHLYLPDKALKLYQLVVESNFEGIDGEATITSSCSNFSWYLIEARLFENALQAAQIAKEADSTYLQTYTNLALSYILTDQFEYAKEIYLEWKDKPYERQGFNTFKDVFLKDLEDLELDGITHPDFNKVRELLEN